MDEVENKWNILKLNDDIWAKLIYFERNRRLAKAYVSAPVLTVDGSTNGLDGFRIGLSGIENACRDLGSIGCLRSIGLGIKLKIDNQGNILIRKVHAKSKISSEQEGNLSPITNHKKSNNNWHNNEQNSQPVWIKQWTKASKLNEKLQDSCSVRQLNSADNTYSKLFDMRRFRMELERQTLINNASNSNRSRLDLEQSQVLDWRQCVSIISFANSPDSLQVDSLANKHNKSPQQQQQQQQQQLLRDPCWVMIINIIAIDMLKTLILDQNCDNGQPKASLIKSPSSIANLSHIHIHQTNSTNSKFAQPKSSNSIKPSPLRTSSSAAILFPRTNKQNQNQNSNSSNSSNSSSSNNSSSINQRPSSVADNRETTIKQQIRRFPQVYNNNRHRIMSPANSNNLPPLSNYRRYQSSQQLSNGSIYTTFDVNSKNINKQFSDYSNSSDYNSASRSSSSGYGSNWHHELYKPTSGRYMPREFKPLSRNKLVEGATSLHKNLSLSNFDLPLSATRSSGIRINYDDYLSENEDNEEEQKQSEQHSAMKSNRSQAKMIDEIRPGFNNLLEGSCCCNITERLKIQHRQEKNPKESIESAENKAKKKSKVSRASIASASSSSSSGCPENDYFMSQSSSSMSSSTTNSNNERELLDYPAPSSQPTSSSGIACVNSTGNTSDEYEHREKDGQNDESDGIERNYVGEEEDATKSKKNSESNKSTPRRGYNIKHLVPSNQFSCEQTRVLESSIMSKQGMMNDKLNESTNSNSDSLIDSPACDCPVGELSIEEIGGENEQNCCDCCDCYVNPDQQTRANECLQDDESIYSRLPHPKAHQQQPLAECNKLSINMNKTTTANNGSQKKLSSFFRGGQKQDPKLSGDFISTIPMDKDEHQNNYQHEEEEEEEEEQVEEVKKEKFGKKSQQKQASWLDRSKYSRMLPKFIFSGNNRCEQDDYCEQLNLRLDKNTQGVVVVGGKKGTRSSTLDKNVKYRLTRSNLDLS